MTYIRSVQQLWRIFLLTAAIFVTPTALAQVCTPQAMPLGTSIKFKSGRDLLIIGHKHGESEEVLALNSIALDKNSSAQKLHQESKARLDQLRETLKNYRDEVKLLNQLISSHKISFVALEFGPSRLEAMIKEANLFIPMAKANLARLKIQDPQLIDDTFLVYVGPALYLLYNQPHLLNKIEVVPVEDDQLMNDSVEHIKFASILISGFVNVYPNSGDAIIKLFDNVFYNYADHKSGDDGWLEEVAKKSLPPDQVIDAVNSMAPVLIGLELFRERDRRVAVELMQQKGSGVYLVGSTHVKNLSNILAETCRKQKR